jgi:hypothetical protein
MIQIQETIVTVLIQMFYRVFLYSVMRVHLLRKILTIVWESVKSWFNENKAKTYLVG